MKRIFLFTYAIVFFTGVYCANPVKLIAEHAELVLIADTFGFTEGPAADTSGNVYFTDIPKSTIYKYNINGTLSVFSDSIPGNGLAFDNNEKLVVCGNNARNISRIDVGNRKIEIVANTYMGKKFNSPNDLWIDEMNGIYFTDPRYGNRDNMEMETEQVYYIDPEKNSVKRVTDDLIRPNGIYGFDKGKKILIADPGASKVYEYNIKKNGEIRNKKVFINNEKVDGITLDNLGNIYVASEGIIIYNKHGQILEIIKTDKNPTNVCFGGSDFKTLFITARNEVYTLKMNVKGKRY